MTRRISDLAGDLKEEILKNFRNSPWVALALDDSRV